MEETDGIRSGCTIVYCESIAKAYHADPTVHERISRLRPKEIGAPVEKKRGIAYNMENASEETEALERRFVNRRRDGARQHTQDPILRQGEGERRDLTG